MNWLVAGNGIFQEYYPRREDHDSSERTMRERSRSRQRSRDPGRSERVKQQAAARPHSLFTWNSWTDGSPISNAAPTTSCEDEDRPKSLKDPIQAYKTGRSSRKQEAKDAKLEDTMKLSRVS